MSIQIPRTKGTYILLIWLDNDIQIEVGKLGRIEFRRGYYAYVGSAFGPGGLYARINRHLRKLKRKFWHIDYLLEYASVKEAIIIANNKKLECIIAKKLLNAGLKYIPRFGSSDCNCVSHLFIIKSKEHIQQILEKLKLNFIIVRFSRS